QTRALKNGIPIFYKSFDSTRMCSVIITIKGGSAMYPREFSGIESALLELMSRGSKKFPYSKIQELGGEKSISFSHSTSYAGSTFSFSCIDYYFDEALPIFLDCFLNPSYDEIQFENMLTEYSQDVQKILNEPESFLFYTMKKEIYKNHPFASSAGVLPESLENITVENLKSHYEKMLDAGRLCVMAAGALDEKKLARRLEKTLGKIPRKENFAPPEIPALEISGENVVLQNAAISGSGHIARVFKSPSVFSDDFIPARIAAEMYNEVLFNIVRTMRGACYTPSTSIGFSPAPFGQDFLYRVSDLRNAVRYLREAQESFASGKMLALVEGRVEYDSIEERLPGFVNKYITSAYTNQRTCSLIAGRAASSLLQLGDIDGLDKFVEQVTSVRAADVIRVFKKYWAGEPARFFAIVGPEDADKIRFE
ncbi:MAG: insulinase family protein, partial [Lachnospiraceae bacterium]|nr:insulinase family protein [Lachnospiraceae bacterium]